MATGLADLVEARSHELARWWRSLLNSETGSDDPDHPLFAIRTTVLESLQEIPALCRAGYFTWVPGQVFEDLLEFVAMRVESDAPRGIFCYQLGDLLDFVETIDSFLATLERD